MRYFIELSYLGTSYHGWQRQPSASSVQQDLEEALSTLLREDIKVVGAGRTDTGVHASYYVAHFDTTNDDKIKSVNFIYHLNAILSRDIAVHSIRRVKDDVNARFAATQREYKYYISLKKNPFSQGQVFHCPYPLNIEKMSEAASHLMSYIDFTSFAKLHTDTLNNNCTVTAAYFEQEGDTLIFTIRANRFLRNMVRAIVGTLLEVGRGKKSVDDFCKIIEAKDRGKAGSSADYQGLFLTNITYPKDIYYE